MQKINLVFVIITVLHLSSTAQLIDFGDDWKYYDNEQLPPADAENDTWIENDFNDSIWSNGNAQLGYGDNDETTTINSSTYTGYFRKTINIADPSIFQSIIIDLIYDDGAIVYLNGIEVLRVDMPTGPVNYNTFANGSSSDNKLISEVLTNTLVSGDNTIAVEVHQVSSGSSDLSFDLQLSSLATQEGPPSFNSIWKYYDNAQAPPDQNTTTWKENTFDDSS